MPSEFANALKKKGEEKKKLSEEINELMLQRFKLSIINREHKPVTAWVSYHTEYFDIDWRFLRRADMVKLKKILEAEK
jgi:mRNA-degrading endonuclease YafQ of YafQ-DinJ toxin-antitoxin module